MSKKRIEDALQIVDPVWIQYTGCCALAQLRVVTWREGIEELIEEACAMHAGLVKVGSALGPMGGAPTLFCVTSPNEPELRTYLEAHGWTKRFEMPRRVGYGPGNNTFWTLTFPKE